MQEALWPACFLGLSRQLSVVKLVGIAKNVGVYVVSTVFIAFISTTATHWRKCVILKFMSSLFCLDDCGVERATKEDVNPDRLSSLHAAICNEVTSTTEG